VEEEGGGEEVFTLPVAKSPNQDRFDVRKERDEARACFSEGQKQKNKKTDLYQDLRNLVPQLMEEGLRGGSKLGVGQNT